MNHRVALVILAGQTRKIEVPIGSASGKLICAS